MATSEGGVKEKYTDKSIKPERMEHGTGRSAKVLEAKRSDFRSLEEGPCMGSHGGAHGVRMEAGVSAGQPGPVRDRNSTDK